MRVHRLGDAVGIAQQRGVGGQVPVHHRIARLRLDPQRRPRFHRQQLRAIDSSLCIRCRACASVAIS